MRARRSDRNRNPVTDSSFVLAVTTPLIHSKAQEITLFGYGSRGTPFAPDDAESPVAGQSGRAKNDRLISCNLLVLKDFIVIKDRLHYCIGNFCLG